MTTQTDRRARGILREEDLFHALAAERRGIGSRAALFLVAAALMSAGLAFLGIVPCLFLTGAGEDMAQCTLTAAVTLVSGNTEFLRETSGWLLAIFVAMMVAVVIMRPRAGVEQAPMETARGVLAALTTVSALVTSVLALFWSASAFVQWTNPVSRDAAHLFEIPLGVLAVVFCAVAATVLRPGLGVAVNNIRWARGRIQSLRQWDLYKRPSQTRRVDVAAAVSALILVASLASTRPYWQLSSSSRIVQTSLLLFVVLSTLAFVILVALRVHLGPDLRVHAVGSALVGVATSIYLFPVAASVAPVWAAALVSVAVAWFLHAASALIAYTSYEMPMPRVLSLKKSVQQELSRCQRIIVDNEQRLRQSTQPETMPPGSVSQNPRRPSCFGSRCHSLATLTRRSR